MIAQILLALLIAVSAHADTPPPNTVKAKLWSGDGLTSVGVTGSSVNSNLTNSSIAVTGTFWQSTQPVSLLSLPSLAAGSNTIGNVNINGTVPISGTITATNSANGATGSAVPAQATQVGGSDGTNLRALKVSAAGVLAVDASGTTVPVSGTFWQATQPISAASLPLPTGAATNSALTTINTTLGSPMQNSGGSVTANIGTTNGLALDASVNGILLGQGSTTSGQSGPLVQGAVTTGAPTYTTAKTSPLSLTTGGLLRVDASGATLPLPTGAATSALQTTGNSTLTTINTTLGSPMQNSGGSVTANVGSTGGLALDTSVTGLQVSQGSTTSGQKGGLTLGAVTTSAPSYTTAQTSPISLTTGGLLRVDASATTVPVSGTFWQTTQPVSLATLPALTAGSAIIGKVGIDQTTPGTTNGVQVNAALPSGTNVIGHVIVDTAPTTAVTQSGTWTVNAKAATPTALTVKAAAVTIGTSAVRLTNDGSAPASTRVLLVAQLLSTSTANCYMGPSSVTSSGSTRGVQMFAGQSFSFTNDAGDYYAICDSSSQTFLITEQE